MADGKEKQPRPSASERVWRFGRDVNVLGALALAGVAALIPGPNVVLAGWAALNIVQAGGFEYLRRHAETKRTKRGAAS